jgi:hypothetical protein
MKRVSVLTCVFDMTITMIRDFYNFYSTINSVRVIKLTQDETDWTYDDVSKSFLTESITK